MHPVPLITPRRNTRLPHRIQQLLNESFAGSTGWSGRQIVDFFGHHSLKVPVYEAFPSDSRKQILEHCLSLFSLKDQKRLIAEMVDTDFVGWQGRPSDQNLAKLRDWLGPGPKALPVFEGHAKRVDWPKVRAAWQKACARLGEDPGGAITASRTLLESTCFHILEERGVAIKPDGDLPKLYSVTARALQVTPAEATDEGQRQILQGCNSIMQGLARLRNTLGDAHGSTASGKPVRTADAMLAVNAAGTLASFLVELHREAKPSRGEGERAGTLSNVIIWPGAERTGREG
jgi:hypothetical protein